MFDYEELHAAITDLRQKQIFFIGGTPKSGTTWLRFLLDAHPEVSCNGEGHFIDVLAPALRAALVKHKNSIAGTNKALFSEVTGYPYLDSNDLTYVLASCVALSLIKQSRHKRSRAIGEKTPDNSRHLPALSTLFPQAKFIHLVRDGRDCAVSGWFHNLRVSPEWTNKKFGSMSSYVKSFARQWATEIAAVQGFIDQHSDRVLQFRYRDLFLNSATASLLIECREAASFERLSGGRKPGEEDQSSFFRKGEPGDWRHHFSAADNAMFIEVAGKYLRQFDFI